MPLPRLSCVLACSKWGKVYACRDDDIEEDASDVVSASTSADTQNSTSNVTIAQQQAMKKAQKRAQKQAQKQAKKDSANLAQGSQVRQGTAKSDFGANLQKAFGQ